MGYNPIVGKIRAIHDHIIVSDMYFGEMKTAGGIVVTSDNGKVHGIKPRWGKVYAIGPKQKDISVGQWVLIEHGRWTRKFTVDDGESVKDLNRIDPSAIMMVSDEKPKDDFYIGEEFSNGDSTTVRPEDFIR